ncbi:MAG: hypothetical protein ACOYO1_11800 [Bacteroidales bacterium]
MKTKYYTITLLTVSLFIFSCKKTETSSNSPTTNNPSAAITYNDGALVAVDSANAVIYSTNPTGSGMQREIDVYAFKGGMQVLEFHFLPKTGSQAVSQDFNSAWLTYMTNNGASFPVDYYNCVSGNFALTTCDTIANKIIGTFDFIGNNGTVNKQITNGTININVLKRN